MSSELRASSFELRAMSSELPAVDWRPESHFWIRADRRNPRAGFGLRPVFQLSTFNRVEDSGGRPAKIIPLPRNYREN